MLPIGDAATYGSEDAPNGYRAELAELLEKDGNKVEIVGSTLHGDEPVEASSKGETIDELLTRAETAVPGFLPNVVVLNAGTADCEQGADGSEAGEKVDKILELVWDGSQFASVVLATSPLPDDAEVKKCVNDVNDKFRNLVEDHQAISHKVVLVDLDGDKPIETDEKGIPTEEGYKTVAELLFDGVDDAGERGWLQAPEDMPEDAPEPEEEEEDADAEETSESQSEAVTSTTAPAEKRQEGGGSETPTAVFSPPLDGGPTTTAAPEAVPTEMTAVFDHFKELLANGEDISSLLPEGVSPEDIFPEGMSGLGALGNQRRQEESGGLATTSAAESLPTDPVAIFEKIKELLANGEDISALLPEGASLEDLDLGAMGNQRRQEDDASETPTAVFSPPLDGGSSTSASESLPTDPTEMLSKLKEMFANGEDIQSFLPEGTSLEDLLPSGVSDMSQLGNQRRQDGMPTELPTSALTAVPSEIPTEVAEAIKEHLPKGVKLEDVEALIAKGAEKLQARQDMPTELPTSVLTALPSELPTEVAEAIKEHLPKGIKLEDVEGLIAKGAGKLQARQDMPIELPTSVLSGLPSEIPTDVTEAIKERLPEGVKLEDVEALIAEGAEKVQARQEPIPTSLPTSILTALPSGIPTEAVKALKEALPEGAELGNQRRQDGMPTELPTSIPTELPTSMPTAIPSGAAEAIKQVLPKLAELGNQRRQDEIPTELPASISISLPTSIPTALPSGAAEAIKEALPKVGNQRRQEEIPTELPTSIPTELPTSMPTALPSGAAEAIKQVFPKFAELGNQRRQEDIPTELPTSILKALPTSMLTALPSGMPSGAAQAIKEALPEGADLDDLEIEVGDVKVDLGELVPSDVDAADLEARGGGLAGLVKDIEEVVEDAIPSKGLEARAGGLAGLVKDIEEAVEDAVPSQGLDARDGDLVEEVEELVPSGILEARSVHSGAGGLAVSGAAVLAAVGLGFAMI